MFEQLEFLGKGAEGSVYKFNDQALKVVKYKDSYEISKALTKISLSNIVTPNELIFVNKEYIGYTMDLIDNIDNIRTIKKEQILESIKILKQDIEVLSNNGILLGDLIPSNSLFSNNLIYLIDTSTYRLSTAKVDVNQHINMREFNRYFCNLLSECTQSLFGRKYFYSLTKDHIGLINEEMNNTETIEDFSLRLYNSSMIGD